MANITTTTETTTVDWQKAQAIADRHLASFNRRHEIETAWRAGMTARSHHEKTEAVRSLAHATELAAKDLAQFASDHRRGEGDEGWIEDPELCQAFITGWHNKDCPCR